MLFLLFDRQQGRNPSRCCFCPLPSSSPPRRCHVAARLSLVAANDDMLALSHSNNQNNRDFLEIGCKLLSHDLNWYWKWEYAQHFSSLAAWCYNLMLLTYLVSDILIKPSLRGVSFFYILLLFICCHLHILRHSVFIHHPFWLQHTERGRRL